jgi:hypothetical protein
MLNSLERDMRSDLIEVTALKDRVLTPVQTANVDVALSRLAKTLRDTGAPAYAKLTGARAREIVDAALASPFYDVFTGCPGGMLEVQLLDIAIRLAEDSATAAPNVEQLRRNVLCLWQAAVEGSDEMLHDATEAVGLLFGYHRHLPTPECVAHYTAGRMAAAEARAMRALRVTPGASVRRDRWLKEMIPALTLKLIKAA